MNVKGICTKPQAFFLLSQFKYIKRLVQAIKVNMATHSLYAVLHQF